MGHTPGPWVYNRHDENSQWAGNIVGHYSMEPPRSIRTISCQLKYGTPEEIEANARLISAAPDMLEALHDVLRYCVTPSGLPDKGKGRTPEQDAAMTKAKAAIAKAEGNQ